MTTLLTPRAASVQPSPETVYSASSTTYACTPHSVILQPQLKELPATGEDASMTTSPTAPTSTKPHSPPGKQHILPSRSLTNVSFHQMSSSLPSHNPTSPTDDAKPTIPAHTPTAHTFNSSNLQHPSYAKQYSPPWCIAPPQLGPDCNLPPNPKVQSMKRR